MEQINKALVSFQGEFKGVTRDSQGHGYKYTSLGNMINTIRPLMIKHGLCFMHDYQHEEKQMVCKVIHSSGEMIESSVPFLIDQNGMQKGMQAIGASLTYARRYSLASALGIADEDDTDCATTPYVAKPSTPAKRFTFFKDMGKGGRFKQGSHFDDYKAIEIEGLFNFLKEKMQNPKGQMLQLMKDMQDYINDK